MFSTF